MTPPVSRPARRLVAGVLAALTLGSLLGCSSEPDYTIDGVEAAYLAAAGSASVSGWDRKSGWQPQHRTFRSASAADVDSVDIVAEPTECNVLPLFGVLGGDPSFYTGGILRGPASMADVKAGWRNQVMVDESNTVGDLWLLEFSSTAAAKSTSEKWEASKDACSSVTASAVGGTQAVIALSWVESSEADAVSFVMERNYGQGSNRAWRFDVLVYGKVMLVQSHETCTGSAPCEEDTLWGSRLTTMNSSLTEG